MRARAGEAAMPALHQAAMAYFKKASIAVAEDPASRLGCRRVQAKLHPDLEGLDVPAWLPWEAGAFRQRGADDSGVCGVAADHGDQRMRRLPPRQASRGRF